jgi:hypothetical protein
MSKPISSIEEYARRICALARDSDEDLLYRGHSKKKFTLRPRLFDERKHRDAECTSWHELVATHPDEFVSDLTMLEKLARARHYSLPTRLLDVTRNPLVALYFAVKEHNKATGEIIVFYIKKPKIKFYDSDTVSCIANLAHLTRSEQQAINFGITGRAFNHQPSVDRLLQFIRMEKPYFRPEIVPEDLKTVLCVTPKQNNRRIQAQAGAFFVFGLGTDLHLDTGLVSGIRVERIKIKKHKKRQILKELGRMGVDQSTMFPEMEVTARQIRDRH